MVPKMSEPLKFDWIFISQIKLPLAPSLKKYENLCDEFNPSKMPRPLLIFSQSDYFDRDCCYKFTFLMANSVDPDQLASSEAN